MKIQQSDGSSKTKSVKGKKKKEKEVCEKQDVEKTTTPTTASTDSQTTTTTATTTTTTETPHVDEYVDVKHTKVTSSDEEDRSLSPDAGDDDDHDSGCGESGDACTSDERYEDHACQTDDTEDPKSATAASKEDVISSGIAVPANPPQCHQTEKSFEDLGVQTEPSFDKENDEAFDKPLLSSSMDEETLVQALRRRSETTDTADLHLIDAILE